MLHSIETPVRCIAAHLILLLGLAVANVCATDLHPAVVGSYATPDTSRGIAIQGNRAFVLYDYIEDNPPVRAGEMLILDISDPTQPMPLGTYRWPQQNQAHSVVVRSDLAYVTVGTIGPGKVDILNVADPTAAYRVGGYTSRGAMRVCLAGDFAYLADGDPGLVVLDVSNPASPRRAGGLDGMGDAWDVFVSGNYAYVADFYWSGTQSQPYGALRIVDVSNPANPKLVAKHQTVGPARTVFLVGHIAYVGTDVELALFDVSDPAHPVRLGNYGGGAPGVVVGDRAYLSGSPGLQILDVSNPATPRRLGGWASLTAVYGLAVSGQHAFALGVAGLEVLDLSLPANLPRVGGCDTPGFARGVAVSGIRAYVADAGVGMQVFDISNPRQPAILSTYGLTNVTEAVAASGNRAFVVEAQRVLDNSYKWTVHVVDATDGSSPKQLGTYETTGHSSSSIHQSFAVNSAGDLAFLGVGRDGGASGRLEIIDVRDPASPALIASYDTSSEWMDVAVEGHHLLLVDYTDGLVVLDIQDPANPKPVGGQSATGWTQVAAAGDSVYLTSTSRGLEVYDLSDRSQPKLLGGNGDIGGTWTGLTVSDKHLYGAARGSGVQVVDVGDPANPRLVGGNSAVLARDLGIAGNQLFVAAEAEGLQVFDLTLSSTEPAPLLEVARSGSTIMCSWPVAAQGFHLQTCPALSGAPNWVSEPTPAVVQGDRNVVMLEAGAAARFFRLQTP